MNGLLNAENTVLKLFCSRIRTTNIEKMSKSTIFNEKNKKELLEEIVLPHRTPISASVSNYMRGQKQLRLYPQKSCG